MKIEESGKNIKSIYTAHPGSAGMGALRITLIYLLIGCLWIIVSDLLASLFFPGRPMLAVSMSKGLLYVLVTAGLIYGLTRASLKKIMASEKAAVGAYAQAERSNTKYRRLYGEYEEKQALLKSLIDSTEDWIFYRDTAGAYLGCNKAFEKYTGVSEAALIGLGAGSVFPQADLPLILSTDRQVLESGQPCRYEQTLTYANGETATVETLKSPYCDGDGQIRGIICVCRDITERKNKENRILFLNYHDTLTGLYNRAYFEETLERLDEERAFPVCVFVCDVDGLKLINDAFGHTAGDALLVVTAEVLRSCCGQGMIARTGDDEFCMLLEGEAAADPDILYKTVMDRFELEAARSEKVFGYSSISLGYAAKADAAQPLDEVIQAAEDYMLRRKLLARNGVHSTLLKSITATLHEKSNETQEHCSRMAELARRLGQVMGLQYRELDALELAASLHDIGKISVDSSILKKPGKLSGNEWEEIKRHPEAGWRISQAIPELNLISEIILCHHERWDGTGYPAGLRGTDIPLLSRMIALVDAFDAMTEDRPYRRALTGQEAKAEILKMAGTQFDPAIAEVFANQVLIGETISGTGGCGEERQPPSAQ